MGAVKLTKRSVDEMQPGSGTTLLWHSELAGFCLRVTAAGIKSFVCQ